MVTGGDTRQESVRRGIEALTSTATGVLCHDAARPLATPELFRVVAAALSADEADGVVPLVPVSDTVKRVRQGRVVETVGPRVELGLAQTPQGFVVSALRDAHQQASAARMEATDDAMLLEQAGYRVHAVPGERSNLKVTTAEDLQQAELMLREITSQPHGRS
jgi:2-C-methyl-D-erythritol 4-phosphate cytidylyltransferase